MSVPSLEGIAAAIEARRLVREEYSKYEANQIIEINGVRAFNKGDRVPAGHVDGYDRPEVDDEGQYTGKTEHIDPVVDRDYVKKVAPAKKAASAATKES